MNHVTKQQRRAMAGVILMVTLAVALGGCLAATPQPPAPSEPTEPLAGMPNPASVYCEEQGGRLDIRTAADGSQSGVCVFPDGSECDEWAFYRGECAPGQPPAEEPIGMPNPASVYCQEQGGRLEIRTAADGSQSGVCVFPDGSECDEWAFYRGECAPGQTAPPPGTPAPPAPTDELAAAVAAELPSNAFEGGVAVLPLATPAGMPPLWAVHSVGMRNYEVEPLPGHFVALYTFGESGWQELARFDLDAPQPGQEPGFGPDYLDASGFSQVAIDPARVWIEVRGGVGAHSGTYQLLSFDGQTLQSEVTGFASSPGLGLIVDLNGDGMADVVLDVSEPYIFCYACGVRYPYFDVYTWLGEEMFPVEISDLMMGQRGTQVDLLNSEAVSLAHAGLWADSLAKIDQAVSVAGQEDPPTPAGSLHWNRALIKLNHDAQLRAIDDSAYPLLNYVFYGDYSGAVNLMRVYRIDEIFSPQSPLIVGTAAEGWEEALANYIVDSADAALAVRPDLAPAHFMRAWARYLANPSDPGVRTDLAAAARLAPDDPFFAEAAAARPAPSPTAAPPTADQPTPIQFEPGGTSAVVGGVLLQDGTRTYVLRALAGQTMDVVATAPRSSLLLAISGADGQVLKSSAVGDSTWSGTLPATQDYFITLSTTGPGTSYTLRVTIPPLSQ